MQRSSWLCVVLLLLVSCHNPKPDPAGSFSTTQADGGVEGPPMMEKGTTHVPIHLTPDESAGLSKAVDGAAPAVKDPAGSHILAEVKDGQLVFAPEQPQAPSHNAADAAVRITLGGKNPKTAQIVATPEARQLLDKRAGPNP